MYRHWVWLLVVIKDETLIVYRFSPAGFRYFNSAIHSYVRGQVIS